MREIKPSEVPAMMLSGELRFGMELEFSDNFNDPNARSDRGKFIGFDIESRDCFCMHISDCTAIWYFQARFPLPDLRDGDPVFYGLGLSQKGHFKKFSDERGIEIYPDGYTKWTHERSHVSYSIQYQWRLPTKQELESAGYPGDYYTSRGINDSKPETTKDPEKPKCSKCKGTGVVEYYHDAGDHFGAGTAPGSEWRRKPCKCQESRGCVG